MYEILWAQQFFNSLVTGVRASVLCVLKHRKFGASGGTPVCISPLSLSLSPDLAVESST